MATPRFIVSALEGDRITIDGREAHHAARVRRLRVGDAVELFDGRGGEATGTIAAIASDRIEVSLNERHVSASPRTLLTIAAAIPKGDRADWMVEKLGELGVARLVPLITERSIVRPSAGKIERWRRKCIETAKQCRATVPMEVLEPTRVESLPALFVPTGRVLVTAPDAAHSIDHEWPGRTGRTDALFVIGPEGGLTPGEIGLLLEAGAQSVRLAATILRIETAAIAVAAAWAMRSAGDQAPKVDR